MAHLNISASLWSADLGSLGQSIQGVDAFCDSYHFDIMDGHFVEDMLFGPDIVGALRHYTIKPFEVHLMVERPEKHFQAFIDAGADIIMFHPEQVSDPVQLIMQIKRANCKAGVAVVAEACVEKPQAWMQATDAVLVMGTKLGIKGVSILPQSFSRIRTLKKHLTHCNPMAVIQADGGIREDVIQDLYSAGADVITAGSLLFKNDYQTIYKKIKGLCR
ncbi:ribulose-phosphate 3-epimerase [bacterium AH-315-K03]|nr:ribulose-phosphate 3-epimerase [bacterium AH-315-K03]